MPGSKTSCTAGHVAKSGRARVRRRAPPRKAAYNYRANEAIGLDGALAKLYNGAYGSWLLGAVALGLIIFSGFSLVEARYRRI